MDSTYKIRKSFYIPLSLDYVLLLILLILSFYKATIGAEPIVLSIIFIPFTFIFLETIFRKVTIDDGGIELKKLFRKKELKWNDITNVDAMIIRKKVYLLLTTTKGFHVLSNSYERFALLIRDIVKYTGTEKVEERVQALIDKPIIKMSDIIVTWFIALLFLGIVFLKIKAGF